MGKNRLAIYVNSYDGYSDLWDAFFEIFEKYWKDCCYPIYLVNNKKEYKRNKVQCIHTGEDVNWFHCAKKSLSIIQEEYVFFLLDDYFFSKYMDNCDIEEIIDFMSQNDIGYYQMTCHQKGKKRITYLKNTNYPVSLQPAIWNRKKFIEILESYNGKSPWDFENLASKQFYNSHKELNKLGVAYDTRDLMGYHNGVQRGKWMPTTLDFYRKKGIIIECGNRPVLERRVVIKYRIAIWISHHVPKMIKDKIKVIITKCNIKYVE